MFDGAFSPLHWLIIAVVALLVLGPKEIPKAARELGKVMRFIREARSTLTDEVERVLHSATEPDAEVRRPDDPPSEE